jgi:hypothetical protein
MVIKRRILSARKVTNINSIDDRQKNTEKGDSNLESITFFIN